jgi:hypothetical protein
MLFRNDSPNSNITLAFGFGLPTRVARWLARFWISAVIVGSLLPGSAKASLRASEDHLNQLSSTVHMKHRLIHFFAFGSSFLALGLLAQCRREELEAAGEVVAVGCLVELTQCVVYSHGQIFEWWDVRDDAIGVAVAFLLLLITRRVNFVITSHF